MKKHHLPTLKFHTIYTLILAGALLATLFFFPDVSLFATILFLIAYVAGNGIIHARKNEFSRDSLVEYLIVALVGAVVVIGAFL